MGKIVNNHYFVYFFSWIFFLPFAVPIAIFFIFCHISKIIVVFVARIFRPDLIEILDPYSAVFVVEDYPFEKPYGNNSLLLTLNASLSIKEAKVGFSKHVLDKLEDDGKQRKYDRFFKYPTRFAQFFFWKEELNFNLDDHIKEVEIEDDFELDKYLASWMMMGYKLSTSPWEILIIQHKRGNSTSLALKMHQSIADGITFLTIYDEMTNGEIVESVLYNKRPEDSLGEKLNLLMRVPLLLLAIYTKGLFKIKGDFFVNKRTSEQMVLSRLTIPLEKIKKIHHDYETHFSTVCFSTFIGALTRYFDNLKQELPESVYMLFPLSWPNHPFRMVNHWTAAISKVKTIVSSPKERLLNAELQYRGVIDRDIPKITRTQIPFLGMIPSNILRQLWSIQSSSAVSSINIPYGNGESFLWGKKVENIYFIGGMIWKNWGLTLASASNNENVSFALLSNTDLLPNQEAINKVLKIHFPEEFNKLLDHKEQKKIIHKDSDVETDIDGIFTFCNNLGRRMSRRLSDIPPFKKRR